MPRPPEGCQRLVEEILPPNTRFVQRPKRRKREGQSFSQVIKEHFDAPKTGRDLSAALGEVAFSDQALEALDQLVKSRRQDAARTVEL